MTAKQVAQQALQVQEKSQIATGRIKQALEQTIEIGTVTASELKRQGEQIKNVQNNVNIVDNNIKRANKQLKVFMRRLATDKIFIVFIFLIVIGIILAIVLYVLKDRKIILA